MEWFLWSCVVAILGLAAVAGSGRFGSMPAAVRDVPTPQLPDGPLRGDDLRGVRFAVATRGYSMSQVDALLDRLAVQLDDADRALAGDVAWSSAIMGENEFAQQAGQEREDDGSNEAPHR